jgi:UDP-N-acetylmuramyl pentapeptide synthase
MENYKKFVWPDHKVIKFSASGGQVSAKGGSASGGESFKLKQFSPEKLSWICVLESVGEIEIGLLGEYALGDVDAAVKIGKSLGMADEDIKRGIANIKPVEHRLQPIKSAGDILVIDDAYNGNPDGVREAIKVLSRFVNRRKVVITPGLVEMGKSAAEVHRAIGKELAGVADVVILIKNSVTGFIAEGIQTTPSRFAGHPSLAPTLRSGSATGGECSQLR